MEIPIHKNFQTIDRKNEYSMWLQTFAIID